MLMRLLHPAQIPFKPILSFPPLNLVLHARDIGAELEFLPIPEPDIVVGLAFHELHALCFQGRVKVAERLFEEVRQKEEGGALVEAVAITVDQTATAAGVGVFLYDGDFEAGLCKACRAGEASDAGA